MCTWSIGASSTPSPRHHPLCKLQHAPPPLRRRGDVASSGDETGWNAPREALLSLCSAWPVIVSGTKVARRVGMGSWGSPWKHPSRHRVPPLFRRCSLWLAWLCNQTSMRVGQEKQRRRQQDRVGREAATQLHFHWRCSGWRWASATTKKPQRRCLELGGYELQRRHGHMWRAP